MLKDFTSEEYGILRTVAEKDDWEIERLERAVGSKMFDGTPFRRALMQVLAEAQRPDEPGEASQGTEKETVDQMLLRVQNARQAQIQAFNKQQQIRIARAINPELNGRRPR